MASFKQRCPSCEAMVTIKDDSLVGKKTDCPKCKYRFVVEAPEPDEDEAPAEKPKAKAAKAEKTDKPPKSEKSDAKDDKPAKGKKAAADSGDDGDGKKKKKKKQAAGGNNTLLIGGAIGGAALLVLGVGAFFLLSGDDSPKPNRPGPSAAVTPGSGIGSPPPGMPLGPPTDTPGIPAIPGEKKDDKKDEPPARKVAPGFNEFTNLLPNKAQAVVSVDMDKLAISPFYKAFATTNGLMPRDFEAKIGFSPEHIAHALFSENVDQGWVFNVLRTNRPYRLERLRDPLALEKGPKSPISGRHYYIVRNEFVPMLSGILSGMIRTPATDAAKKPLGFCLLDEQTLVFADLAPLEEFLAADAKHRKLSEMPPSTKPTNPLSGAKGGLPGIGTIPPGSPPVPPPGGAVPPPAEKKEGSDALYASTPTYLTIDPALKAMLDHLEDTRTGTVASLVVRGNAAKRWLDQVPTIPGGPRLTPETLGVLGVSLRTSTVSKLGMELGVEFPSDQEAKAVQQTLAKTLEVPAVTEAISQVIGSPVQVAASQGTTPGMMPMPGVPPSGIPPTGGPFADPTNPGSATSRPEPKGPVSTLASEQRGKTVYLTADLAISESAGMELFDLTRSLVVHRKGIAEVSLGKPRWHELAGTARALRIARKPFPPGTYERPLPDERLEVPWPVKNRVSWMAGLMPFVGQEEISRQIAYDKSWRDPVNLKAGANWIAPFLNPAYPREYWQARLPSLPGHELGATHFVGLTGLGLDAAEYAANDPRFEKKLGVFGYNRETTIDDIKDGLQNTIFAVQVPPVYQRPWIAGGGATLAGVPESKSVEPFVTMMPNGKRGTYAMMADGSVRFIAADIADKVFQAMSTIRGGEELDAIDQLAPVVPPPKGFAEPAPAPVAAAAPNRK